MKLFIISLISVAVFLGLLFGLKNLTYFKDKKTKNILWEKVIIFSLLGAVITEIIILIVIHCLKKRVSVFNFRRETYNEKELGEIGAEIYTIYENQHLEDKMNMYREHPSIIYSKANEARKNCFSNLGEIKKIKDESINCIENIYNKVVNDIGKTILEDRCNDTVMEEIVKSYKNKFCSYLVKPL